MCEEFAVNLLESQHIQHALQSLTCSWAFVRNSFINYHTFIFDNFLRNKIKIFAYKQQKLRDEEENKKTAKKSFLSN